MRRLLLCVPLVLAAAACGDDDVAAPPMLLIATDAGPAVLDGATGDLGAAAPGGVASPGGDVLVQGELLGTGTVVHAVEVVGGAERWSHRVEGSFQPRVVAADVGRVALSPLPGALTAGALAPGRTSTELVVLHEDGDADRYDLAANVEPEAFSLDSTGLFVVQFLPPELPTTYQVRRLDLRTGELEDVYSPDAHLQQAMGGYARTQVWAPDGSRLYTLYTTQVGSGGAVETVAFVHVLDLDDQWAHCIGLPDGFSPASGGLALADGGGELAVADVASGIVAVVDTEALAVERSATLPVVPDALSTPIAFQGDEVLVGAGPEVLRLDRETLEPVGSLAQRAPVVGLQASTVEDELYVATTATVIRMDVATGEVLQRTAADQATIGSFTGFGGSSTPTYSSFECAC